MMRPNNLEELVRFHAVFTQIGQTASDQFRPRNQIGPTVSDHYTLAAETGEFCR